MKKIVKILLFLYVIIIPHKVFAYDYVIDNYDVYIVVNSDNKLDITEKISVNFNEYRHGIYRKIPLKNSIKRLDGSSAIKRVKIKNISVNEEYNVTRGGNYKIIKIGSKNHTIIGTKDYIIKYTYDIGNDKNKKYDELYFNIIGDDWDTTIKNVNFKITMPKEFDETKLGFSKGSYGSTSNDGIYYQKDGNVIKGYYINGLLPNEALTVRLELEEGYFTYKSNYNLFFYLTIILPIVFVLLSYYYWNKYGRDDKVVETVEFYPPDGLNSLEVALYYKGTTSKKDVVSLLIYLANKGYLKIIEGSGGKKEKFQIVKLKDYDGDSEEEKIFLEGLFKKGDTVTDKDLKDKFYTTVNNIIFKINRKIKNVYEKNLDSKELLLIVMNLITTSLILIGPLLDYEDNITIITNIFLSMLVVLIVSVVAKINKTKSAVFISIIVFIFAWLFISSIYIFEILFIDTTYLPSYIVGTICMIFITGFIAAMKKRNKYGIELLGKIGGFKNFLNVAEKDRLEKLVESNPKYFYDILPFTYVLGVSDKWIKQFEGITDSQPEWYEGYSDFNIYHFERFIDNAMASTTAVTPSSTSSGGFSSGGGFSGGGFGGGGGGSW